MQKAESRTPWREENNAFLEVSRDLGRPPRIIPVHQLSELASQGEEFGYQLRLRRGLFSLRCACFPFLAVPDTISNSAPAVVTFVQRGGALVVSLVHVDDAVLHKHAQMRQVAAVCRHVRRERQVYKMGVKRAFEGLNLA